MTSAVPPTPTPGVTPATQAVKSATPEIILFDEAPVSDEIMINLLFEDIGGEEILMLARTDTVDGQSVIYQPIKNLVSLNQEYNPQNILSLQGVSSVYFKNFPINLDYRIPNIGNGPNGEYVYIDPVTGQLVVEAVNLESDEQIEIHIIKNSETFNDTI